MLVEDGGGYDDHAVLLSENCEGMSIIRDRKTLLSRVLGAAIVLLIFGFMLRTLYLSWKEIVAYDWHLDYLALITAFSLMLSAAAFYAYLWKLVLERLGTPLSYRKSYRIFFLSQLGRYLPGKVWGILGLVYLSQKEGVSKVISGASVTLQLLLQVISGIVVFAVTLPFWQHRDSLPGLNLLLLLLPAGLILLHPALVNRGLNLALRATGQAPIELSWGYGYLLSQLGLWAVFWLVNGVAQYFLIRSIYSSPLPQVPVLAGVFAIAWVAGFLSLVTPSGLGVMEGTLVFLLSFYFPVHVSTIVALWTRLAKTAVDLVCAGTAWRL
jgi:uncharacterized membrane protein YbhN (UPF0104 family)